MLTRPTRGPAAVLTTVLVALVAAVLAAGCSSGSSGSPAAHDAADVAFAQGMLPHHRQAVEMAALAPTRAASPEVRDLAAAIDRGQGPEIDRMTAMLTAWGAPEGGGHATGGMTGMMSGDAMAQLERLSGPAFDDAFLRMMIEHHTGAVQMAGTETAQGSDPGALDLARTITSTQQDEIGRMRALLERR